MAGPIGERYKRYKRYNRYKTLDIKLKTRQDMRHKTIVSDQSWPVVRLTGQMSAMAKEVSPKSV